jgi:hypothetical protein
MTKIQLIEQQVYCERLKWIGCQLSLTDPQVTEEYADKQVTTAKNTNTNEMENESRSTQEQAMEMHGQVEKHTYTIAKELINSNNKVI